MKACAYIVGPEDGPGAALIDLARRVGFDTVLAYKGLALADRQALQTPLLFFLFAALDNPDGLKPVADAIRFSPSRRVRFSPMVYFSESPSLEAIRLCIGMGFDDVITLPFTLERVGGRLARQVDRTVVYCESGSYFGPDRRSRSGDEEAASGRRGGQYRTLEIVRNAGIGINVLRDDQHVVI